MRDALAPDDLKQLYRRLAGHYDVQHGLITFASDQRGRRMLVERAVSKVASVLDCGCGTGSTGIMSVRKVGDEGHVTFFDLSDDMLKAARERVVAEDLDNRARLVVSRHFGVPLWPFLAFVVEKSLGCDGG